MFSKNSDATPLIIDTDNAFGMPVRDIDDGVALALALGADAVDVKAIVASSCNCRAFESAQNTLYLLEQFGVTNIPVGIGAEMPLSGDREPHHAFLDAKVEGKGKVLWEGIAQAPEYDLASLQEGAELLIETVKAYPHEVVVVALGSFTNLGIALQRAPEIAGLIKEVVHMGGVFEPQEGELALEWNTADIPQEVWDTTLRFNTWYDREATATVIRSGVPVRFITANVTSHFFLMNEQLDALQQGSDNALSRYFLERVVPWQKWNIEERKVVGAHMHDPLAVLAILQPELCEYRDMKPDVAGFLDGYELFPQQSEQLLKSDSGTRLSNCKIAVNVEIPKAAELLVNLLQNVLQRS